MEYLTQWIKSDIGQTVTWIFSIICLPIIGLIQWFLKRKKSEGNTEHSILNQSITGNNNEQAGRDIINRKGKP